MLAREESSTVVLQWGFVAAATIVLILPNPWGSLWECSHVLQGMAAGSQGAGPSKPPAASSDPSPHRPDGSKRAGDFEESASNDPEELFSANAACGVCHMSFLIESLSRTHLAAKIPCIHCHGLSAGHANDENIGATKPDIVYPRDKIDPACQKCHPKHDVPARAVVARWLERELKDAELVCTDCHGHHRIRWAAKLLDWMGSGQADRSAP